jgi:hypothetical protein
MPFLILGVIVIAIQIAVGRGAIAFRIDNRTGLIVLALASAIGALVLGIRGTWISSIGLIGISGYLVATANRRRNQRPPERPDSMSVDEARRVLGVGANAGQAEIDAAYRRLMLRAHPDHGGSSGLAAQLNAARDRLLKKL